MDNQTEFILKVVIVSAGLSVLIKYVGPNLAVGATVVNALMLVFVPALIVAIALWWRSQHQPQQK